MTVCSLSVPRPSLLHGHGLQGLPLDMSRIHPECPGSDPSDRAAIADVGFREEPDEEEDEEKKDEGDVEEGDDDDDENSGYSVCACPSFVNG